MAKIHLPTPSIDTVAVVVHTCDREAEEIKENRLRNEAWERAYSQVPQELFDKDSHHVTMDGDKIPVGDAIAQKKIPVKWRSWEKCLSCGYEKPMHTECGLPCI